MNTSDLFREGLNYLLSFEGPEYKILLRKCAKIDRGNFSKMLRGDGRGFNDKNRQKIADCLSLTVEELVSLGRDQVEGNTNSLLTQQVLFKKMLLPEMTSPSTHDIFAINPETLKQVKVGDGWELKTNSMMVEFEQIPCVHARYIWKPKFKIQDQPDQDSKTRKK